MFLILSVISAVTGSFWEIFSGRHSKPLLLLDLDDTLYFDKKITYTAIGDKMDKYCRDHYGMTTEEVTKMCLDHSSPANGLKVMKSLSNQQIFNFLVETHDVSLDHLKPDEKLKKFFLFLSKRVELFIFTAGPWFHAMKVLLQLGLGDIFPRSRIIHIGSTSFKSKYLKSTFDEALRIVDAENVEYSKVYFVDDSLKNVRVARWRLDLSSVPDLPYLAQRFHLLFFQAFWVKINFDYV